MMSAIIMKLDDAMAASGNEKRHRPSRADNEPAYAERKAADKQ